MILTLIEDYLVTATWAILFVLLIAGLATIGEALTQYGREMARHRRTRA